MILSAYAMLLVNIHRELMTRLHLKLNFLKLSFLLTKCILKDHLPLLRNTEATMQRQTLFILEEVIIVLIGAVDCAD